MRSISKLLIVALLISASLSSLYAAPPREALVTFESTEDLSVDAGLFYEAQRRPFVRPDESILDVDVTLVGIVAGVDVIRGVNVNVEAAWTEADEVDTFRKGQGGMM